MHPPAPDDGVALGNLARAQRKADVKTAGNSSRIAATARATAIWMKQVQAGMAKLSASHT